MIYNSSYFGSMKNYECYFPDGTYPSYLKGIIGTVPDFGLGTPRFSKFKQEYTGNSSDMTISSILTSDALRVVHRAVSDLDASVWDSKPNTSCQQTTEWDGGYLIMEEIISNTINGLSGDIRFDSDGLAETTAYSIFNFKEEGFEKVGSWSEETNLVLSEDIIFKGLSNDVPSGFSSTLTGFHLRVGLVPEAPVAYHKESCGNDTRSTTCWYGYNVELVQQLSLDLNFTYEYVVPEDGKYGGYSAVTREWNGLVRDLIADKIDLALALSINSERSAYIDYTLSFYEDRLGFVLYESKSSTSSNPFFFLLPFHISIWISILGMIFFLSIVMTVVNKMSPYDAHGKKIHAVQTCKVRLYSYCILGNR